MIDEILKRIDALAAKLGVTAVELWRILIKQARVDAIFDSVWILISLLILYSSYRWMRWGLKRDDNVDDELQIFSVIISTITAIVFTVVLVIHLIDLPTPLINPEYRALELLRNAIK